VPDAAQEFAEQEYRQYLVGRALRLMRSDFEPATWQACWQHVVEGKSAAAVAAALGISPRAVYVARSRVVARLRQELAGLLE
jgi:RNA polymerase sigma-70 factor (ECF subfamily)